MTGTWKKGFLNIMKILRRSGKAEKAVQWAGYLMVAYLLASWGVNGVVNPMHYVKNAFMSVQAVEIKEDAEKLILELPNDGDLEYRFLSFKAVSQNYSLDLHILGYPQEKGAQGEAAQETVLRIWKGWNCIDLDKVQGARKWTRMNVTKHIEGTESITLETVELSEYKRMETGRMIYIMLSFLILAAFWECVWWIKERYAKANENR